MATSDDLMRLARACADRIDPPRRTRQFPSFSEAEEQCEDEYETLLEFLHEDEVFEAADLDVQERLVEAIRDALPEPQQALVEQLVDNQAAQVWLQQEGAFHLGMAVGMKLAQAGYRIPSNDERPEEDEMEAEDRRRFGSRDAADYYDEDEDEEDEEDEDGPKGL
jgi:hypothetical protein